MIEDLQTHYKVLVADDDEDFLELIQLRLTLDGFRTQVSPNAKNIFVMIAAEAPDIILLDIKMKDVNGADVCRMLKSDPATHDIPVIIFSANHNIREIATECGANECITKPFDSKRLKEKLLEFIKDRHAA